MRRRVKKDKAKRNVWRSYSDLMSGLLLLFVLIMAVCLMQAQKNYSDKLAQQAKLLMSQSELEESRRQLTAQQEILDSQQGTLNEQESELARQEGLLADREEKIGAQQEEISEKEEELESQRMTLTQQAAMLDQLQKTLEGHETVLTQKESELTATGETLAQKESELAKTSGDLAQKESELTATSATLAQRESELEATGKTLAEKESELQNTGIKLAEKESELESTGMTLAEKESEIALNRADLDEAIDMVFESQEKLDKSQAALDEANALMRSQQEKIDKIIGVKSSLIESLGEEFNRANIAVQIDSETGAIALDSSVLYEFGKSGLTEDGKKMLNDILPIYLGVLLSDEHVNDIGQIIVEGYTDSVGDYLSNMELSQERAGAVASYMFSETSRTLTDEQFLAMMEKLSVNGRSSSNAIFDENGLEDAEASRRVEIKFRLKDEEMIEELKELIGEIQPETGEALSETEPET